MTYGFFGGLLSFRAMASLIQVTRSSSSESDASTPAAISSLSGRVIRTGYSFFLPISQLFRMYDIDDGQNISYVRFISKGRS